MRAKYIVFGGTVVSKTDGDHHHVGVLALARLYGLSEGEWIDGTPWQKDPRRPLPDGMRALFPRNDGNYDLLRGEPR
jgi:hypothetical protein